MAYQYNKSNSQSSSDKAVEAFAAMIISRLEEVKASEWKKGWIGGNGYQGMPQNMNGRTYSGTNSLFLFMHTAMNNYAAPIYLTFLQKEKEGLRLNKGAKAMPVVYWDWNIKDAEGKKVSLTDYRSMSKEEREHCEARPFLRSFRVYNIDQTNMKEVNKEKYDKLVAQFQSPKVADTQGMYKNAALDRMFEHQEWLCKIHCDKPSAGAFFNPTHDFIVIPQKEQFKIGKTESDIYKDGMEYYSTALHEMTHSTGTAERLNRNMEGRYGDPKYAKEELVAELSAAMVGNTMGFDKRITDNSAAYIDGWLHTLREEPRFIMSVMADVNKASNLILEKIDEQKLALGEKPILNNKQEEKQLEQVPTESIIPKWDIMETDRAYTDKDVKAYTERLHEAASKLTSHITDARILEDENGYRFLFKNNDKMSELNQKDIPATLQTWLSNVSTEKETLRNNGYPSILHKGENVDLIASLVYTDINSQHIDRSNSEKSSITAGIYKQPAGNYVVRASVDGQELEPKPIDNKTAVTYLKIDDNSQKDKMLSDIVKKHYGEELSMPRVSQHVSQGLKIR
ncbi:ArdC family protein [Prevotella bivia]|uniref:ArdC family protein n=1 Tax=Prevotella bivia TaxID=28125 RepID=UPI00254C215B|nr:zincin-like metallopeptidase domain-containing protein [Prevotella bivia]MDZ3818694.1 zincin-like metallopeptidase domain-containing protein [Prevotella bivia]